MNPLELVLHYHESTKHHPHRMARSLGYLDWATQPDPFRRFRGAPVIPLLLSDATASPSYDALYEPGAIAPQPVCLETVSTFLQFSLALSAWKEFQGSRWSLRINPSSGNLHPTEGYLILGEVERLTETSGVFHYRPQDHVLERRCQVEPDTWRSLVGGFPCGTFLFGLSSVHWREAWKYGERAYRYCQHDVGHALAAVAISATAQGWLIAPLPELSDATVGSLLGLDRQIGFEGVEVEHADVLIAVIPVAFPQINETPPGLPSDAVERIRDSRWVGSANRLGADHVEWELIDSVAEACAKHANSELAVPVKAASFPAPYQVDRPSVSARRIIQQRRSAVAMDGRTSMSAGDFYRMMDRVLPRFDHPPWTALGPPANVDLCLFVHLVEGLAPGLYALVRSADRQSDLRESMHSEFAWSKPAGCPEGLPLYHLVSGDVRELVGRLSCNQDIAADGAFSLGMIADFERALQNHGPWMYRRLFWETGMIGQVLYLEAEAAGLRGTGIGCFLDDPVHDVFGIAGRKYQSLYHFTVGGPVADTRVATLPPYPPEIHGRSIDVNPRTAS